MLGVIEYLLQVGWNPIINSVKRELDEEERDGELKKSEYAKRLAELDFWYFLVVLLSSREFLD